MLKLAVRVGPAEQPAMTNRDPLPSNQESLQSGDGRSKILFVASQMGQLRTSSHSCCDGLLPHDLVHEDRVKPAFRSNPESGVGFQFVNSEHLHHGLFIEGFTCSMTHLAEEILFEGDLGRVNPLAR